jgi:DNA-binding PadR family transcriptional regulator
LHILSLLAEQARSGREVMAAMSPAPSPAAVYPALEYLRDHEFVEPVGERRYRASAAGLAHLECNRVLLEAIASRTSPPMIAQAFEEVRQALELRGPCPDPQEAERISRILRRAAQEIAELL